MKVTHELNRPNFPIAIQFNNGKQHLTVNAAIELANKLNDIVKQIKAGKR